MFSLLDNRIRFLPMLILLLAAAPPRASAQTTECGLCEPPLIIQPPDFLPDVDYFGFTTLICGKHMVAGWAEGASPAFGAPLIYRFTGANWEFVDILEAPSPDASIKWGERMVIDGNLLAVRDRYEPIPTGGYGTVTMFRFQPETETWEFEAKLVVPPDYIDVVPNQFGSSISIDGDTIVVGQDPINGVAHIFNHVGNGKWVLETSIEAPPKWQGQGFSGFVIQGDMLLATAGAGDYARILCYQRTEGKWNLTSEILPPQESITFGYTKDLDATGTIAGFGAPGEKVHGVVSHGAVYMYQQKVNEWQFLQKLLPSELSTFSPSFGAPTIVNNDASAVIISAGNDAPADIGVDTGSAFVFRRVAKDEWVEVQKLAPPIIKPDTNFGIQDIEGDIAAGNMINADDGYVFIYRGVEQVDCDGSGVVDGCEIAAGILTDINADQIPDVCQPAACLSDANGDAVVDSLDLNIILASFGCQEAGNPAGGAAPGDDVPDVPAPPACPYKADLNADKAVDSLDLNMLLQSFGQECPPPSF